MRFSTRRVASALFEKRPSRFSIVLSTFGGLADTVGLSPLEETKSVFTPQIVASLLIPD